MIRNSWRVQVLKEWFAYLGDHDRPPCTRIEYLGGVLYIERGGTRYNVDKLKKRGLL